ncbi:MAG: MFS transporter [Syntrophothermus sp.]
MNTNPQVAHDNYLKIVAGFHFNAKMYLVYSFLNSITWAIFSLVFNLYIYSLGYHQDFIGLLNAVPSIATMILGLPVGIAADRLGYKPFLLTGGILTIVSIIGFGLGTSSGVLLVFAFLFGCSGALTYVVGAPFMMANSRPAERVYLFSINFAIEMGANFLGFLLAGALPEIFGQALGLPAKSALPLRWSLLSMVVFLALALIPITFIKPNRSATSQVGPLKISRAELGLFARLLFPTTAISLGAGAMVTFFQLFFSLKFRMSTGSIGVLFAFSAVVTALASLMAPKIAERYGKVRSVVGMELASIPFLLVLAFSNNLPLVVGAYYVRSALMNMGEPIIITFNMEQVGERHRATLNSLEAMLGSLGRGGLGPLVSGFLQVRSGFSLAFTFTTLCYIVAAVSFYLFFRSAEKPLDPARGRNLACGP